MRFIKPRVVQINQKFGRLVVLEECIERKHGGRVFKCICECGKIVNVSSNKLASSPSPARSCGCLQKEKVKNTGLLNAKTPGEVSWNHLERKYKIAALKRNLEWKLTKQEFRALTSKNCYWCNTEPRRQNRYYRQDNSRNKETNTVSDDNAKLHWINANGIDRINSNLGYILNNCVPCCQVCNLMKLDYTENEFLENIKRIFIHQKELNEQQNKKCPQNSPI